MKIVGLAFLSTQAVRIAIDHIYDISDFPSVNFSDWLKNETQKPKLVFLSNPKYFEELIAQKIEKAILFCQFNWLSKRGILTLDSEQKEEVITLRTVTPQDILDALSNKSSKYKRSESSKWMSKGKPKHKNDKGVENHKFYSLANMIHIALNKSDENLLMVTPKEVWEATYKYAGGKLTKNKWLNNYGRSLATAGVPEPTVKEIVNWVKHNGKKLANGKLKKPVSKKDLKYFKRFVSSSKEKEKSST